MTLPREEVVAGLTAELENLEKLIRSVSEEQWNAPTRCSEWTVGDIARHVIGTISRITQGRVDEFTDPATTQKIVDERRGRSARELADELAEARPGAAAIGVAFDDETWNGPAPAGIPGTLGAAVEGLWFDAWVHIDDINDALGLAPASGPGLRASVSHLSDLLGQDNWGPALLALDGMDEFNVGSANGRRVQGDAREFVLAATGRSDPEPLGLDETVNVYRPR